MSTDPRKRQKQLARKNAKRKEKKHSLIKQQNISLADRLTAATRYPVLHCWISDNIEQQGIGWVSLSREFPNGEIAVASFLVDTYCLGVKNCFGQFTSRSTYEDRFVRRMRGDNGAYLAPPAEGRKLIEAAVAYARDLGLQPHPDYAKVMCLFGDINSADSDATFTFGDNGKPHFIAGPNDTAARCRQVMSILTNKLGPNGFNYTMPLGDGDLAMFSPATLDTGKMPELGGAVAQQAIGAGGGDYEEDDEEEN